MPVLSLIENSAMGTRLEASGLATPAAAGASAWITTIVRSVQHEFSENKIRAKLGSYGPNDSAYGSSPAAFTSPGQASWSNTATPASAGPAQWNYSTQPANHLFHQSAHSSGPSDQSSLPSGPGYHYGNNAPRQRFPKGEGDEIYGYYNAKLGNTPGNLHYEEVDPCMFNMILSRQIRLRMNTYYSNSILCQRSKVFPRGQSLCRYFQ
jgi:hypothetical protein